MFESSLEVSMKWALRIFGGLLVLMGIVWFFQGINVLLGSFMSGRPDYAILGVIVAAVGIFLIIFSNRRRAAG